MSRMSDDAALEKIGDRFLGKGFDLEEIAYLGVYFLERAGLRQKAIDAAQSEVDDHFHGGEDR